MTTDLRGTHPAFSLDAALPESPLGDFNELQRGLQTLLTAAREAFERHTEAELSRRLEKLEEIEVAHERAHRQMASLQELREEFLKLGEMGRAGMGRIDGLLQPMDGYLAELGRWLQHEALVQAAAAREAQARSIVEQLEGVLARGEAIADPEAAVTDLLKLSRALNHPRAVDLMQRLRGQGVFPEDEAGLRAEHRFWLEVARSQFNEPMDLAESARQRAREIQAELSRRATEAQAKADVESLCAEVMRGVDYLDQLGPQEIIVQLNVWTGKLRYYQDGFDLPQSLETRIFHSFGAVNTARKRLKVDYYFDSLDRNVTRDWKQFVEDWDSRRSTARAQDELEEEAKREKLEQERLRQTQSQRRTEQAQADLLALRELLEKSDPHTDPIVREEFHSLLEGLVENDGGQLEELLRLLPPHADLLANRSAYRSLRRSMSKRNLWPPEVTPFAAPEERGAEELQTALAAELTPPLRGRSVLLVGGIPRDSVQQRLTTLLELDKLNWPNGWDHDLDLASLERSIGEQRFALVVALIRFVGHNTNRLREACTRAGVPYVMVDRGCGATRILQAIRDQASLLLTREKAEAPVDR